MKQQSKKNYQKAIKQWHKDMELVEIGVMDHYTAALIFFEKLGMNEPKKKALRVAKFCRGIL